MNDASHAFDEFIRQPGDRIPLASFAEMPDGDIFAVSYNLRTDEYTLTYAKRVQELPDGQPEETAIIEEVDGMHCADLCRVFTRMTGIEIPEVEFR
ncbi:MAG: hypothetical protein LBT97_02925 [Planctomycetota bacterium]|jgi:hypothetical protein|nr:hypothetical protein [Planctomycetota bacterium]